MRYEHGHRIGFTQFVRTCAEYDRPGRPVPVRSV
ncbi:MAG: hypothetical protein J4F40_18295 [Alphaproteobacteria bacterium]|nr:hypothetical protein [Alphaproteobacteria bacterium]